MFKFPTKHQQAKHGKVQGETARSRLAQRQREAGTNEHGAHMRKRAHTEMRRLTRSHTDTCAQTQYTHTHLHTSCAHTHTHASANSHTQTRSHLRAVFPPGQRRGSHRAPTDPKCSSSIGLSLRLIELDALSRHGPRINLHLGLLLCPCCFKNLRPEPVPGWAICLFKLLFKQPPCGLPEKGGAEQTGPAGSSRMKYLLLALDSLALASAAAVHHPDVVQARSMWRSQGSSLKLIATYYRK